MTDAMKVSDDQPPVQAFESRFAEAEKYSSQYRYLVSRDPDGGFVASVFEMPGVVGAGATPDECMQQVEQNAKLAVAVLLEQNQKPPTPALRGRRSEQVNVRLTPEERQILQIACDERGFRSMSEYVRIAALQAARGGASPLGTTSS